MSHIAFYRQECTFSVSIRFMSDENVRETGQVAGVWLIVGNITSQMCSEFIDKRSSYPLWQLGARASANPKQLTPYYITRRAVSSCSKLKNNFCKDRFAKKNSVN